MNQTFINASALPKPKITASSGGMLLYLSETIKFLKDEAKLVVAVNELQLDGFQLIGIESQRGSKAVVSVEALRKLQNFLDMISDQPVTIEFDHYNIYVNSIII